MARHSRAHQDRLRTTDDRRRSPDETTDPAQLQLVLGNLRTDATGYRRPPIEVTVANAEDQAQAGGLDITDAPNQPVGAVFARTVTRRHVADSTPSSGAGTG